MPRKTFAPLTRFRWQHQTFQVKQHLDQRRVVIEDLFTGYVTTVPLRELETALFKGELHFEINGPQAHIQSAGEISTAFQYLTLDDCPAPQAAIARHRYEIIAPLLELQPQQRTRSYLDHYIQQLQATISPTTLTHLGCPQLSRATLYRWLKRFHESGHDLRSLVPNTNRCGAKGVYRLDTRVEALVNTCIQTAIKSYPRPLIEVIYHEICLQIHQYNTNHSDQPPLAVPSQSTITRRYRTRARQDQQQRPHQQAIHKMDSPHLPLERVEIDHTLTDLIVLDDSDHLPLGRLNLTLCLDVKTRYPLGYHLGFDGPSYQTVSACLYHAISLKPDTTQQFNTQNHWQAYGLPTTLVTDNGAEFRGRALQEACQLLGIRLQHAPVYRPQYKPHIERYFGTLNTGLFHAAPGTTHLPPELEHLYNSSQAACVYLSQIDQAIHLYIVDIYAESFHTGIQAIPARQWEAAVAAGFTPALPTNLEELRILLAETTTRVIARDGINLFYLRYNSVALTALRLRLNGTPAKIKYQSGDLSHIDVYDPFELRYLSVPALDQDYTHNLSLWKHRIIVRRARHTAQSVNPLALAAARRQIQALFDSGKDRRRRARWQGKKTQPQAAAPPPPLPQDQDWHLDHNVQHTQRWLNQQLQDQPRDWSDFAQGAPADE